MNFELTQEMNHDLFRLSNFLFQAAAYKNVLSLRTSRAGFPRNTRRLLRAIAATQWQFEYLSSFAFLISTDAPADAITHSMAHNRFTRLAVSVRTSIADHAEYRTCTH